MSTEIRDRLLVAVGVLLVGAAVWAVLSHQHSTSERTFREERVGQRLLNGMLDQETGLRGYLLSGEDSFLEPTIVAPPISPRG